MLAVIANVETMSSPSIFQVIDQWNESLIYQFNMAAGSLIVKNLVMVFIKVYVSMC
jgi:hypothetical protein